MSINWFKGLKRQWRQKICKQVHGIDQNCKSQVENSSSTKGLIKFKNIKPRLHVCSKSSIKKLLARIDKVYAEMKIDIDDSRVFGAGGGGAAMCGGFSQAQVNITLHTYMPSMSTCALLVG
ncbi:hypothetical protein ACOSP7_007227 [Xanthoceras sorbifolium]|uniref:Uncharacterized protein n=1 Tax=Xanthoceras sorbifolium TaxID=99658 RepID=A0ABQ8IA44_9ROSI|nr:hypothetical protein JRO89_XS03G0161400 [Xanthoceras sorbifolium]